MSRFEPIDIASAHVNSKKAEVQQLREWTKQQKHLPEITEFQAVTFLHSNYFDMEAAKKTVESFFALRSRHADYLDPILDEDVIRETLSVVFLKILPEKTPEGCIVLVSRLIDPTPSKFVFLNYQKVIDMILMTHLYKYGPSEGLIIVYDGSASSFGHVWRLSYSVLKVYSAYFENALPLRLKQMHYVNTSSVTTAMLNFVKPFLSQRIQDLYNFHSGNHSTLFDHVPKEILPKEVYGNGKTVDELREGVIEELLENMEFFKWLQTQKSVVGENSTKKGWFRR